MGFSYVKSFGKRTVELILSNEKGWKLTCSCLIATTAVQERKAKSEGGAENGSSPGSSSSITQEKSDKSPAKCGDDRDERLSNSSRGSEKSVKSNGSSGRKASSVHWKGDSSVE